MDLIDLLLQAGLITAALVSYLIFFRRSSPMKFKGKYREPGWNYLLRLLMARLAVKKWKWELPLAYWLDTPRLQDEGWDRIVINGAAPDGSTLHFSVRILYNKPASLAEATVHIKLSDGTTYRLPQHPDTITGRYEYTSFSWSAGGLKIELLENCAKLRILYNGLLKRDGDGATQHVRINMIWSAASPVQLFPEDWSNELAAQALALEPWRGAGWHNTLNKVNTGSWLQWGAVQGRFESYTATGAVDRSEYMRVRGVRERNWSPRGHVGLRRDLTVTAVAKDGTCVQLKGFSHKEAMTLGYSGCVRFPNCLVESITGTDLVLAEFCELPDPSAVPDVYTINVSTKSRTLKLVIRANKDGGRLLSGVPYQYQTHYRTLHVDIDGYPGTGLLELGYEYKEKSGPVVSIPRHRLRWAREIDFKSVGYCLPLDAPAAACPGYVGGKAASLSLLASVQADSGYRVPPGYCLTRMALEKHLEANPQLKAAIAEIKAASVNYDENNFRSKCNKAVELFASTEIVKDVRDEIISHLHDLRKNALEQNLGPELRFAVRSSAVGEDSEALSAAGQNETILGCKSDADVVRGVQLCWGSMFAFTSAYYRRQNGQRCECGGGVVVQALVRARAAGVLFSRHPAAGDPARVLVTANYGLGETVVSGTVEPDTIIVSRDKELVITSIELGSKLQRARAEGDGVTLEDVSEEERRLPCLTVSEALALARIGVEQDEMWGAGRDIEWAIAEDEIFLLQARPITSLERWSEEELLHELDSPIMSDDDFNSFANTGEVMPRPMTPLSHDLVLMPMLGSVSSLFGASPEVYDHCLTISHHRPMFSMYNSLLKTVSNTIDLTIRMGEMSVCGHKVIDDRILEIAQHRRPPSKTDALMKTIYSFKYLLTTKSYMNDAIKLTKNLKLDIHTDDRVELMDAINKTTPLMSRCIFDHAVTSTGSTVSQFIAMMTLVEGGSDFTNEQCNEISTLFSSGSVLSAEVPQALAKLKREILDSGREAEFRKLPPKEAMDWLNVNLPAIYYHVCEFLEQHGHRSIMEFDLATKPWSLVPEEMVEVLQNMPAVKEEKQVPKSDAQIVEALKTPKKSSTRTVLRWILPLCRRTVQHREVTKGYSILMIHKLRLAIRRLAHLMVRDWLLPEEDLVFYFRIEELRNYLLYRDPVLIKKAMQRRQYHPSWCKLKFAESNEGWVEPMKERKPQVTKGDVRLEATAVCVGEVVARACVIKDFSEVDQLQSGDVLITHCTDIGWSPYFPLLSGIVTELGGLISHGAVIAREYGLPCLVGATDATYLFRTGDLVRLSATEGVLETVQLAHQPTDSQLNSENKCDIK